ncbi:hypothetical protein BGP_0700 [Beggiatoa sp. PS]|nr:hypothetical protein BGP_0700 [Beggiatoa sp. PS]
MKKVGNKTCCLPYNSTQNTNSIHRFKPARFLKPGRFVNLIQTTGVWKDSRQLPNNKIPISTPKIEVGHSIRWP